MERNNQGLPGATGGEMHLPGNLNAITPETLQRLIDNEIPEDKWIEYKSELPSSDQKRNLQKAVTSFANTVGGHIIYGIEAVDGIPRRIVGLPGINPDALKLALTQRINSTVSPKIPGLDMRYVSMGDMGVLIISVPRSRTQPHAIRMDQEGTYRYYGRHNAGAYPLSIEDLRVLFNQTGAILERVRRFRLERVSMIVSGDGARALQQRPGDDARTRAIMLHLLPLSTFDDYGTIDPVDLRNEPRSQALLRPMTGGSHAQYTFDGFLTVGNQSPNMKVSSYLQLFGNGAVEVADMQLMALNGTHGNDTYSIDTPTTELRIISKVKEILQFYQLHSIPAPVAIMLTVFGADGYPLTGKFRHMEDYKIISTPQMFFPEVMADTSEVTMEQTAMLLRPVFNKLWNAAGYEYCHLFQPTQEGWTPTPWFLKQLN